MFKQLLAAVQTFSFPWFVSSSNFFKYEIYLIDRKIKLKSSTIIFGTI